MKQQRGEPRWRKVVMEKHTIQQRDGKDPDIEVTLTRYIPPNAVILDLTPSQPKRPHTKKKADAKGITKGQFHNLLNKASQPTEPTSESGEGQSQT